MSIDHKLEHHKALAFIGQHFGEEIIWLKALECYAALFPDDLYIHLMKNVCCSSLSRHLGYKDKDNVFDIIDAQKEEINRVTSVIQPELVLDLHTEQNRRTLGPSYVYVFPSRIDELDKRILEFEHYDKGRQLSTDDQSILWWGLRNFPELKSYTVEYGFGGLEHTSENLRILRNSIRSRRTARDFEDFRKQVFDHPQMAQDIIIARNFVHFLYNLNINRCG